MAFGPTRRSRFVLNVTFAEAARGECHVAVPLALGRRPMCWIDGSPRKAAGIGCQAARVANQMAWHSAGAAPPAVAFTSARSGQRIVGSDSGGGAHPRDCRAFPIAIRDCAVLRARDAPLRTDPRPARVVRGEYRTQRSDHRCYEHCKPWNADYPQHPGILPSGRPCAGRLDGAA